MPFTVCLIPGCRSNINDVKLFCFPQNETLCGEWIKRIIPHCPQVLELTHNQLIKRLICIRHFEAKYLVGEKRMYNSCPTLISEEEICSGTPTIPFNLDLETDHIYSESLGSQKLDHLYYKKHEFDLMYPQPSGAIKIEKQTSLDSTDQLPAAVSTSKEVIEVISGDLAEGSSSQTLSPPPPRYNPDSQDPNTPLKLRRSQAARPRGKRAGKSNALKQQRLQLAKKTAKRDQCDNTLSPHITGKQTKPNLPGSLAQDGSNHPATHTASVQREEHVHGICLEAEPFRNLTQEEFLDIERAIVRFLVEDVYNPEMATTACFGGNTHLSEGVMKLWCLDDFSLKWICAKTKLFPPLADGARLVVKNQSALLRKVKAGVFLPNYNGEDVETIHGLLIKQNGWIDVGRWSIYAAHVLEDHGGVYAVLGIPEVDTHRLITRGLCYKEGTVYPCFGEDVIIPWGDMPAPIPLKVRAG